MIDTKTLQILEYDRIAGQLADCAPTEGAKQLALRLHPETDLFRIRKMQKQTTDAKRLLGIKGMPPFGAVYEISTAVERAEKGAVLSAKELLEIADVFSCARRLHDYASADRTFETVLDGIFERLQVNRPLEEKIRRAILAEDLIADEASPALADIRRKMRDANRRIKETLQKYVTGASHDKFLQDHLVTTRNGRYVIPVKAEYRGEVKGLIHDTSASGATLFIEPMSVVEANNELRELETKEQREIERILAELSALAADQGTVLQLNYYNITELAFHFAKAELSFRMDATQPAFNENHSILLRRARHPLLQKDTVVPIDVELGTSYDTLVITGPNTGGKTVTLKTLGLFTMMAQSGLHLPLAEGSELCVLSGVLADIGDEQSIAQSLSTFSAHMVNTVRILREMDADTLVLFDELGAGTDPVEGAALAVAILEHVKAHGALCAATTHYAELKAYALNTARVQNASCEFNLYTLRPTYRLIIGTPGKSNAFAISRKLGLPEEIVSRADAIVSSENKEFEQVIEKLEQSRLQMEENRRIAEEERAAMEQKRAEAEERLAKESAATEKEMARLRAQAEGMLAGAKAASEMVFAELERLKKQKDAADFAKQLEDGRREIRRTLKETDLDTDTVLQKEAEHYVLPRHVRAGDSVVVISLGQEGEVVSPPDKKDLVQVQLGNLRTRVRESDLMLREDRKNTLLPKKKSVNRSTGTSEISHDFAYELDVRGETGEDAWLRVDKYLDEAAVCGMHTVRIIHGKGTGALKKALWEFFRRDPRIKSYRLGVYGEGDSGVTVIELK